MKNAISAMTEGEVKARLEGIERYNDHFRNAVDEKGNSLAHHMVTPRQLWNIMTREWGVDPRQFGISEPPPSKWEPKKQGEQPEPAPQLENLSHGL